MSRAEQKRRFLERIDQPEKNWKFSLDDVKERGHWKDYMEAYEDVFTHTSTDLAPWYIIPADNKWFMRVAVAEIIHDTMQELRLALSDGHAGAAARSCSRRERCCSMTE